MGNERDLVFHVLGGFLFLEFYHGPTTNTRCLLWVARDQIGFLSRSWKNGDLMFRKEREGNCL
jgi:hypothetical protein